MADNKVYKNVYKFVLLRLDLSFLDIYSLLKITKQEGKVISIIISYIG